MIWQDTLSPLARLYRYDVLNRLKMQDGFEYNKNAGTFQPTNAWATRYSYDKMGNITSLLRNASANTPMDKLSYNYYSGKNQLSYVNDAVSASAFANDIDNQNKNNYQYDLIGNLIQDNSERLIVRWTHYGKVKQIDSIINSTTTKPKLKFTYDALGNRLTKHQPSKPSKPSNHQTDIYIRDAQGNLVALYQIKNDSLFAKEFYMYGSSRLGYTDENIFLAKKSKISNFPLSNFSTLKYSNQVPHNVNYTFGKKRYEINDWLGNVRVVISDKKIPIVSGNVVTGYNADVRSVTDYYPFSFEISERTYSTINYRFSFNGKEDIREQRWLQDYGARFYNKATAQFISADPLIVWQKKYPWLSSYQFASDNPIWNIDLDGLEGIKNDNASKKVDPRLRAITAKNVTDRIKSAGENVQGSLGVSVSVGMSAKGKIQVGPLKVEGNVTTTEFSASASPGSIDLKAKVVGASGTASAGKVSMSAGGSVVVGSTGSTTSISTKASVKDKDVKSSVNLQSGEIGAGVTAGFFGIAAYINPLKMFAAIVDIFGAVAEYAKNQANMAQHPYEYYVPNETKQQQGQQ